jgi:hypothetical protein
MVARLPSMDVNADVAVSTDDARTKATFPTRRAAGTVTVRFICPNRLPRRLGSEGSPAHSIRFIYLPVEFNRRHTPPTEMLRRWTAPLVGVTRPRLGRTKDVFPNADRDKRRITSRTDPHNPPREILGPRIHVASTLPGCVDTTGRLNPCDVACSARPQRTITATCVPRISGDTSCRQNPRLDFVTSFRVFRSSGKTGRNCSHVLAFPHDTTVGFHISCSWESQALLRRAFQTGTCPTENA